MADDNTADADKPGDKPADAPEADTTGTTDSEKDGGEGDASKLGDAGKRALDAMKRERNAARKELQGLQEKLKSYEDKDKSETQRLQESLEEAKARAAKAEAGSKKLQTAIDRAPEGATMTQIRAVAKRLSGDTDEELEADADELFELVAGAKEPAKKTVPTKPKEKLSGGGDPDEEPDETDPRKLADLIGRR